MNLLLACSHCRDVGWLMLYNILHVWTVENEVTLSESMCNKHIISKVLSINAKKLSIQTKLGIISAKFSASNPSEMQCFLCAETILAQSDIKIQAKVPDNIALRQYFVLSADMFPLLLHPCVVACVTL